MKTSPLFRERALEPWLEDAFQPCLPTPQYALKLIIVERLKNAFNRLAQLKDSGPVILQDVGPWLFGSRFKKIKINGLEAVLLVE